VKGVDGETHSGWWFLSFGVVITEYYVNLGNAALALVEVFNLLRTHPNEKLLLDARQTVVW
jgi:hypothetical protein